MIANSQEIRREERAMRVSFPRARRIPSARNMEIYEAVRSRGQRQADVARRFGMNQQRVSQICRQVEKWHEWLTSSPDYEANEAQERRRVLLVSRHREEQILLLALRQAVQPSETLVTERRSTTARGTQVDRCEKVLPVNPAWLNLARRAVRGVARISEELGVDVETNVVQQQIDKMLDEIVDRQPRPGDSGCTPKVGANSSTSSTIQGQYGENEHGNCRAWQQ